MAKRSGLFIIIQIDVQNHEISVGKFLIELSFQSCPMPKSLLTHPRGVNTTRPSPEHPKGKYVLTVSSNPSVPNPYDCYKVLPCNELTFAFLEVPPNDANCYLEPTQVKSLLHCGMSYSSWIFLLS